MPINPNIALGAQQQQQPINMLGQMGQLYALRAAKQEFEGGEALRDFYAGGGDTSTPEGRRALLAANPKLGSQILNQQSEMLARDVKTQADSLKTIKENVGAVNTPEAMAEYLRGAYTTPGGAALAKLIPLDRAISAIPTDPKAFADYKRNFGLTADKLFESADAQLSSRTSLATTGMTTAATMRGQDILDRRERERLHTIETATGPGVYNPYDKSGVIRPMTQAPWSPPGATAAPPVNVGGGALGSGTFNPTAPVVAPTSAVPTGASAGGGTPSVNALALNLTGAPIVNNLRQQQGAGGFTQAQPKGPSAITTVNAYVPASEAAQGEYIKSTRATFDQLKHAPTVLDNIEKAKALIPTAKGFMGTGGETMLEAAKFMNNRLGTSIDTAGIKSAEELNSRLFMGIMDNLKKMDAQPSQQQQAAMKQALGSIGTDPNAMGAVLDVFGDIVRGKVDIHNQEVMDAETRGTKFPYNPVIKLPPKTANTALPPIYATNGKERIVSTDGGTTWNPAGAK